MSRNLEKLLKLMRFDDLVPEGHKGRLCEACVGKRVESLKSTGKAVLGVAVMVGGTAIAIMTNGKIDIGKK